MALYSGVNPTQVKWIPTPSGIIVEMSVGFANALEDILRPYVIDTALYPEIVNYPAIVYRKLMEIEC